MNFEKGCVGRLHWTWGTYVNLGTFGGGVVYLYPDSSVVVVVVVITGGPYSRDGVLGGRRNSELVPGGPYSGDGVGTGGGPYVRIGWTTKPWSISFPFEGGKYTGEKPFERCSAHDGSDGMQVGNE
ncbi:unnamed protein product, partial [Allacma fusca]